MNLNKKEVKDMKKKFIVLIVVIAVSLIVTSILYSIILIKPVDKN